MEDDCPVMQYTENLDPLRRSRVCSVVARDSDAFHRLRIAHLNRIGLVLAALISERDQ